MPLKAPSLSSSVPCPSVGWFPPSACWARDEDTGSVSKEDQVGAAKCSPACGDVKNQVEPSRLKLSTGESPSVICHQPPKRDGKEGVRGSLHGPSWQQNLPVNRALAGILSETAVSAFSCHEQLRSPSFPRISRGWLRRAEEPFSRGRTRCLPDSHVFPGVTSPCPAPSAAMLTASIPGGAASINELLR